MIGLSRALAAELAGEIGLSLLIPGGMDTAFFVGRTEQYRPGPDARLNDPAIVTGAESGIGRAVAVAYAREGADVVLSYLPSEEKDAREVVALVEEAGRTAVAVPGDVSDEDCCNALVERAVDESAASTSWSTTPADSSTSRTSPT